MLASTALLICAHGAIAAEVVGDAQIQARDLLSGTVGGQSKFADVSSAISPDDPRVQYLDAQEQARSLLFRNHFAVAVDQAASPDSKSDAVPAASVQRTRRTNMGGQELAQGMLLGKGV
jgi:hypothetical protein